MSEPKSVAYLQAAEAVTQKDVNVLAKDASESEPKGELVVSKTTQSVKRQRTLMEMMSGTVDGSTPSSKRPKVTQLQTQTRNSSTITISGGSGDSKGPSSTAVPLNSIPFSLSAYVDSMDDEERMLLRLEYETMGKSWLKVLHDEIKKPYFLQLKRFLWKEGVQGPNDEVKGPTKVYPIPKNIYSWSNTPLGRVKIVIIGQDPYHGPGQAHGLSFSVPRGVIVPPSLRNIYKEIKNEYAEFEPPKHGNLSAWANNGVLLLNTALTVRASEAGSHSNRGWEQFTDKVVDIVDKYGGANLTLPETTTKPGISNGVVFLAWGNWAAKRVARLSKTKHLILLSAHPSPLSASRGFFGNGHFKKANEWLESKYGKDGTVAWCSLD